MHTPSECALYQEETPSCFAHMEYAFLIIHYAPAVKADISMVHFNARQLA